MDNDSFGDTLLGASLFGGGGVPVREFIRFTEEMPGSFFIYRAETGRLLYANQALFRVYGCKGEEDFHFLTGGTFQGMVHPDDLADVESSIRRQLGAGPAKQDYVEYRIVRKDGKIRWVEDFGHYLESEKLGGLFYVFLADVTARHRERTAILEEKLQRERELQEQAEQQAEFLEQMNDELTRRLELIAGLSADYETVFHADLEEDQIQPYRVSRRPGFQFGRDLQVRPFRGFAGEYIDRWVHPDDRETFRKSVEPENIREKLAQKKSFYISYRLLRDGEPEYVQAFIVNVSPEAGVTQIMFGCRTVDEEVRREKARAAMLEDALRQAKQAGEARNTFLSNMSHDMRTPMNAIIGFTALAQRHLEEPERLKKDLSRIHESSTRLLRLVNDVLELSWLESGKVHIEETACSLPELTREVTERAVEQAQEKGVALVVEPPEVAHPRVWCDRPKLRQALSRLASSVLKCTAPGGHVRLYLRERSTTRAYGSYHFSADCLGLEKNVENSVFRPLDRREVTSTDQEGADLGLAIVRHVVELMGGTVEAEPLTKDGIRFNAALNLRLQEEAALHPTGAQGAERRVLVVEDNELNREIAQDLLEEAGFLVETAENGKIGFEKVRDSHPGYYALVLMDLRMPVMDGHAAARAIRALEDPGLAGVPIVALSANTFDEDRKQSAESGMNAHLEKPLDVDRLLEVISGIMGT